MTNYIQAKDSQRHDLELRAAVMAELVEAHEILTSAKSSLEKAYRKLQAAEAISDELDELWNLYEARLSVYSSIKKFDYRINSAITETYVGNVAAFMSPEKAEELKEKHRGG